MSAAKAKLQGALDQFKDARPAELDQQFRNSGADKEKTKKSEGSVPTSDNRSEGSPFTQSS